jgi:hypothetical protein
MEKCEDCGATINDFEECTHSVGSVRAAASMLTRPFTSKSGDDRFDDFDGDGNATNVVWPYLISPLSAIFIDYLFPVWSTWYVSLLIVIASFMITNTVLNIANSGATFGFKPFLMSLLRSINAPGTIALRSGPGQKSRNIAIWSGAVIAAVILVFSNVTTANANHLEKKLAAEGRQLTGKKFEISCPSGFTSGLPGSEIVCSAKVIFGLSVPVKVQINGPFESFTWKAGW